ncbi:vegetative cell wall protein gp1-like [Brachypodium distachyon]|uniref:vegetative cell wall protein gp1-like n=1 Tax=Brachypodium distachyon TaxID=15368 RepID=UPI0005300724|nr:vegetative cell wall protein gp1-like [Brachypodium distachyon]|eukprot:XP_010233250.1 vegetative cell wall protein gp1-like [Brachypodium distachyon]
MMPRAGSNPAAPPATAPLAPIPSASEPPATAPSAFTPTDLVPPDSPEYTPSMEWMLAGQAPPMLGEDDDFVLALAPPPLYCPIHRHGPCPTRDGTARPPPSPTLPTTPPRLNINTTLAGGGNSEADHGGDEDDGLDDVHSEARRFVAAMAAHRAGPVDGDWNPATIGLSSSDEGWPSSI